MGNKKSKSVSKNENNQLIISETDINTLNSQINKTVANTVINSNKSCQQKSNLSSGFLFKNCKIGGDFIFDNVNINQESIVDFSCIQVFDIQQDLAQTILSELMKQITTKLDDKTINFMNSTAESQVKSGFLSPGNASSDSNSQNKFNLTRINKTNTNIQNILSNSINVNFNIDSIQNCIQSQEQEQVLDATNCDIKGDVIIKNWNVEQSIKSFGKCLQNDGIVQKIINTASNDLNIKVISDTKTDTSNKMTASTKSKTIATGPIEEFVKVIDSIGKIFTSCCNCGKNLILIISISIIIILLICSSSSYFLKKK